MIFSFTKEDSKFLAHLRALSIFIIVFGHVGGFWVLGPSSKFLLVFLAFFFFISGVVNFVSIERHSSLPKWILRRFISLYVPYLLFCIIPFGVYVLKYHTIPTISFEALFSWIKMYPAKHYMPYPLGHLWFIQTLMIISLFFVPLMFCIFRKNSHFLWVFFFSLLLLSFLKFLGVISNSFYVCGISLYKPLVYSVFYVLAWIFLVDRSLFLSLKFFFFMFLILIFILFLTKKMYLNVYLQGHIHPPDVYYVLISILSLLLLVRFKKQFNFFFFLPVFKSFSRFFFKHTYAIYLLHTFAIFLSETVFSGLLPVSKTLLYGLCKLGMVLVLVCCFSVVFDFFSSKATKFLLFYFNV